MVAVVLKNADFTEGRGPMLFHSVWDTYENAAEYVSRQDGIYGSKQCERGSNYVTEDRNGKYEHWNGYYIYQDIRVNTVDNLQHSAVLRTLYAEKDALEEKIRVYEKLA